jgi:U32 family peptidase
VAIPSSLPELLLPAGGFDSAIASIEGGADALYLGFSDFSARKQAKNFDRTEYRKLYRYARDKGIKLYAALNTVIEEDEMEGAARLLSFLGRFPPDAVIVQDWGLARLVRDRHPGIAIHASTQAAVQGGPAALIARELGASRIILPRETSLSEMRRIKAEAPELEYETFVHGALCYSFSGLCLASGLVLGRSGNRGECAQLCRSYYSTEDRTGYWFSCRDLDLSERLGELAEAGISSFKIEGRMKSPEYCFAVASLYRGLIDRMALAGAGPADEEIAYKREAARIAFARASTEGWIDERGGASLIDSAYPGHRGVSAGRVVSNERGRLVVDLVGPLGLRDGLLGFERGDPSRPVKFPVIGLRDARSGREIVRARAGSRIEIVAESEAAAYAELRPGDELRRISSRELDRRKLSPEEFEAAKEALSLRLHIGPSGLGADLHIPSQPGRSHRIEAADPIPEDIAKTPGGLERALSLFDESGDCDFRLEPELDPKAHVELAPGKDGAPRSCSVSELFIPPSALKREKNRIYAIAAELVAEAERAYASDSMTSIEALSPGSEDSGSRPEAPPRAAVVFPRVGLPLGSPFATARDLRVASGLRVASDGAPSLPSWGGRFWMPLAPLVVDREAYAIAVKRSVAAILGEGLSLSIGLGALHHFPIARELLGLHPEAGNRLAFFLDINLYVANSLAENNLSSLLPRIEFAYGYVEAKGSIPASLAEIGEGFEPPLFQSLGCFLKHHIAKGACPSPCGKSLSAQLSDRDRRYRVIVEDCVTMLFRIPKLKTEG